jgi:hypothetical protein
MLQFDSNLAPIVGQQVTLTSTNSAVAGPRIDLLIARAAANECDVVVKGTISGLQRGAVRLASGQFRTDRASEALLSDTQVRALATAGQELTYTCVPPGNGTRIGVDRDEDGFRSTEIDAGSDPADPSSIPRPDVDHHRHDDHDRSGSTSTTRPRCRPAVSSNPDQSLKLIDLVAGEELRLQPQYARARQPHGAAVSG